MFGKLKMKVYLLKAGPPPEGDHYYWGSSSSSSTSSLQDSESKDKEHQNGKGDDDHDHDGVKQAQGDPFITLLESVKVDPELVPVLVFQYTNLDRLWRHLRQHPARAGIVFTSPRCVYSVIEAIKIYDVDSQWPVLQREWASKPVFCVGSSTMSKAKQLFPMITSECLLTGVESHAESLAEKIIEVNSKQGFTTPLLYPCGVLRRDVLQKKLGDAEIQCDQCVVYDSVKNPSLDVLLNVVADEIKTSTYDIKVLCFFSPSGVKNVCQHLELHSLDESTHVIAIGPTTKAALEELFASKGVARRVHQCKEPTPEALVDVLQSEICLQKCST